MTETSGFPESEYQQRCTRAQRAMGKAGISALLLTTEPDLRYFTGFLTRFWESPTRPWFLILPAAGKPIAVIPSIGVNLMSQTWISDIRAWRSPDYQDDGLSLLCDALKEVVLPGGYIGVPSAGETHLRMPLATWNALPENLPERYIVDDAAMMRDLRMVKSDAEIAKIRTACDIAARAFDRVPGIACRGVPLDDVFRRFQMLCLEEGADWVTYLAGAAGPGGYGDVISPATSTALAAGDVLMLDTGLVKDGYFCDFDRNFSIGPPSDAVQSAYGKLIEATFTAFDLARPGLKVSDLFHAMDRIVTGGAGGSDAGRFGHGLGMQLTEPPSLIPQDRTILCPGMVLTLEPGIEVSPGRLLVHEENIVIRENGAEWLTRPAGTKIEVLSL